MGDWKRSRRTPTLCGVPRDTVVMDDGVKLVVRLDGTDIFTFDRGTFKVRLDSGGRRTVTVKKRINETLFECGMPWRVYQSKGRWYAAIYNDEMENIYAEEFVDGGVLALYLGDIYPFDETLFEILAWQRSSDGGGEVDDDDDQPTQTRQSLPLCG